MTHQVFVVELPDEARAVSRYLRQAGTDPSTALIVGLEPSVRAILKEQGFDSVDTLPFFDNASHAALLRASTEFDQLLQHGIQFTTVDGLQDVLAQAAAAFVGTRLVLMLKAIEVLEGIRRFYPESTYCFCSQAPGYRHPESLWVQPHEGYLSSLGPKFCQHHGLSVKMVQPLEAVQAAIPQRSWQRALWCRVLDRIIAGACLLSCRVESRSKTVLATTSLQAMDTLARSIPTRVPQLTPLALTRGRRGRRIELRDAFGWLLLAALGRKPAAQIKGISQDLIKGALGRRGEAHLVGELEKSIRSFMERHGERFRFRAVSFLEEVQAEIKQGLVPYLADLHQVAQAQACILRHLRPSLVLSFASTESWHTLGRLSAKAGVPAMIIPLKTLVRRHDELGDLGQRQVGQEMVSNDFPFVAVQTPLAQDYLRHTGYTGQLVVTGPLLRARVTEAERGRQRARFFQEMGASGKVVIYAPSMKRIHTYHVVQTLDEVFCSMADLVEVVSAMEGVYLILRLHPDQYVTRKHIETLIDLPRNVTVSDTDRFSFAGVLALADLLISNASTTSEEAILNGVPVVLYDRWARYNHLDATEVCGRVPDSLAPAYYVSAKRDLGPTVDWVLRAQPQGTLLPPAVVGRYVFRKDYSHSFYDFVARSVCGSHVHRRETSAVLQEQVGKDEG